MDSTIPLFHGHLGGLMFRIWNILTLIEDMKRDLLASSGREADTLAVSDATIVLAGLGRCNRVAGLDIEIHDDLPVGESYVFRGTP